MLSPRRRVTNWPWRVFGGVALFALMFGVYTWGVPLIHASVRHLTTGRQLAAEAALGDPRAPHTDILDSLTARKSLPGSSHDDQQAEEGDAQEGELPDTGGKPRALTKEFIEDVAQDGYVMVAMANEHYLDFTLSWIANIEKTGIMAHILGATDEGMYKAMTERGVPTWLVDIGISAKDLGWGTKEFMKLSSAKVYVLQQFAALSSSVTVILSDVDTAWLRNPIPYFNRYPEADILASTDMITTTVLSEELEWWPAASARGLNVGIMMVRPTDRTRAFLVEWANKSSVPNAWDQTEFSLMLQRNHSKESCGKGLWEVMNNSITVGALNPVQFGGHMYFVQRKHDEMRLEPYVVHTVFQYGGTPGKRNRLREAMLFEDPPSYYDHPKGFINIRVDIPQDLLDAANGQSVKGELTEAMTKTHFALINYQLLWIRAGIALAQLTGRALIMPRIWAELDRYWPNNALWDGNLPGSRVKKPFVCPMDHVMNMEHGWFEHKQEDAYGPDVEWREYSFLQNPRLPKEVYTSRLSLEICQRPGDGCSNGWFTAPNEDGLLRLAPGLDSDRLFDALNKTSQYKILDVTNIISMWPPFKEYGGWFTDTRQHQQFVRRIKEMTDYACCTNVEPKWIHYDMLWDVKHSDKFGRQFDAWRIMRGDRAPPPSPVIAPPPPKQASTPPAATTTNRQKQKAKP